MSARIVLVADVYDAPTTDRAYGAARPAYVARDEIDFHAGSRFCTEVVQALRAIWITNPDVLAANEHPQPVRSADLMTGSDRACGGQDSTRT